MSIVKVPARAKSSDGVDLHDDQPLRDAPHSDLDSDGDLDPSSLNRKSLLIGPNPEHFMTDTVWLKNVAVSVSFQGT